MKTFSVLFCCVGFATAMLAEQITPVGIEVWPNPRFSNETPPNAIDGNTGTYTWSTESFTAVPNFIGLDFGLPFSLNQIRLYKDANGGGGPNIKDLTIQYTTDVGGALSSRSWNSVTGMVNGTNGTELLMAIAVNSDGTVLGDTHDSLVNGFASLTFDPVLATGVRIGFANPGGGSFVHYRVYEFQVFAAPIPEPGTMALGGLIGIAIVGRGLRRRID